MDGRMAKTRRKQIVATWIRVQAEARYPLFNRTSRSTFLGASHHSLVRIGKTFLVRSSSPSSSSGSLQFAVIAPQPISCPISSGGHLVCAKLKQRLIPCSIFLVTSSLRICACPPVFSVSCSFSLALRS